jgi:glycosyltransferase involved in cell wall biosynthesis
LKKLKGQSLKLSVIIPAYNRAHLIGETLRSLLMQTRPAEEIIVVDDGSTDDTAEVAQKTLENWKVENRKQKLEFKIIRQQNKGPAAARNAGFAASKGEFIHFFDSDDLAAPNKQAVQLAALEKTGADIAIGPSIQGRFAEKRFVADNHVFQQNGLPREPDLIRALLSCWSFVPHSALFRRSIVEKAGGFPEDLCVGEDQFMFLACLLAKAKVVHTSGTIEFYRQGDSGKITESREWALRRFREWARFLMKAREACLKQGIEPLRWSGYRLRLWEALLDLQKAQISEPRGSRGNEAQIKTKSEPPSAFARLRRDKHVGSYNSDEELMNQLHSLAPAGLAAAACRWHRKVGHWRGGLQQRLTGGRAHGSFRIGPITPEQIALLNQLGYSYEAPTRLPWRFN